MLTIKKHILKESLYFPDSKRKGTPFIDRVCQIDGFYAIVLLIISFCFALPVLGAPNPAAVYCAALKYDYVVERDKNGDERGYCILPDGRKVDAWQFFNGKIAPEYSYCALNGYQIRTKITNNGTFTSECAVCEKLSKGRVIESASVMDLMQRTGRWPESPLRKSPPTTSGQPAQKQNSPFTALTVPGTFDLRSYNSHNYVNPIRDQGDCGSCYAFGAIACAEGEFNWATASYDSYRIKLSEAFIMWCLGKISPYQNHFYGCIGSDYDYFELQGLVDSGSVDSSYFPYTIIDPGSCTHWNDPRVKFSGWQRITCGDIDAIKNAIYAYGTIDASVYNSSDWGNYAGGVYSDADTICSANPCYYTFSDHVISLVGWGSDSSGGFWILRNSWGAGWGENGYMRTRMKAAAVACEACYLNVNPGVLRNYTSITKSQFNLKSGYSIKFIARNSITIRDSFTVQQGASFTANVNGTGLPKANAGWKAYAAPQQPSPPPPDNQYTVKPCGEAQTARLAIITGVGNYFLTCKMMPNEPLIIGVFAPNARLELHNELAPQHSPAIKLYSLHRGSYIIRVQSGRLITYRKVIL